MASTTKKKDTAEAAPKKEQAHKITLEELLGYMINQNQAILEALGELKQRIPPRVFLDGKVDSIN